MVQADSDHEERAERSPEQWSDKEIIEAVRSGEYALVPTRKNFEVGYFTLDSWESFEGAQGLIVELSSAECRFVAPQMYGLVDRTDDPTSDSDSLKQNPNKEG